MNRRELFPILAAGMTSPVAAQHFHGNSVPELATDRYKLRFFTPAENKLLDVLSEMIIPADAQCGGAREAHLANYMDLVVSYAPPALRERWRDGLKAVDEAARQAAGKAFADADTAQQAALMDRMAAHEDNPAEGLESFFVLLKSTVINGYIISPVGMKKWMGWKGHPGGLYPACDVPVGS